jgi:hypothetical protein
LLSTCLSMIGSYDSLKIRPYRVKVTLAGSYGVSSLNFSEKTSGVQNGKTYSYSVTSAYSSRLNPDPSVSSGALFDIGIKDYFKVPMAVEYQLLHFRTDLITMDENDEMRYGKNVGSSFVVDSTKTNYAGNYKFYDDVSVRFLTFSLGFGVKKQINRISFESDMGMKIMVAGRTKHSRIFVSNSAYGMGGPKSYSIFQRNSLMEFNDNGSSSWFIPAFFLRAGFSYNIWKNFDIGLLLAFSSSFSPMESIDTGKGIHFFSCSISKLRQYNAGLGISYRIN